MHYYALRLNLNLGGMPNKLLQWIDCGEWVLNWKTSGLSILLQEHRKNFYLQWGKAETVLMIFRIKSNRTPQRKLDVEVGSTSSFEIIIASKVSCSI